MDRAPRGSLKLDIASAYLLTAARLGTWLVVAALVFRQGHRGSFATMTLLRSTVGLLTYFGLGIAPAVIHFASRRLHDIPPPSPADDGAPSPAHRLYLNSLALAAALCAAATVALIVYLTGLWSFHTPPPTPALRTQATAFAFFLGIGVIVRILSDPSGAMLQVRGRVALDNLLQAAAELAWAVLSVILFTTGDAATDGIAAVGLAYLLASVFLLAARLSYVADLARTIVLSRRLFDSSAVRSLLAFGGLVALAQLADFLYAPTDYILINRLLTTDDLTAYAPAVQVDAALLLTITALATVLLPHSATAYAARDLAAVRRFYVRGTLASLALLVPGALAAYLLSPIAFRLWLGDPMPATQAILPFVLVHTVIGGSSAVGRSILLAVGKVKPFTASVLLAGLANVLLSYVFVRHFHLGLRGIVLGTIVAVTARCALWIPWYVLRTLRRGEVQPADAVEIPPTAPEVA